MRERLVAVLVGLTVAVVALYGVPRAYLIADLVVQQQQREVGRSLDLIAIVVDEKVEEGHPVTASDLSRLLQEGESLTYVAAAGGEVSAGPVPAGHDSDVVESRLLDGGGEVTLSRSGVVIDERVSDALVPIVMIGLALVLAAVVVALILARRLARPFQELAEVAALVGRGQFDVTVNHYPVPEAEAIGAALRLGASRLNELVKRERDFAVHASHELRTPITSLRLQLEDLTRWPQTDPEVTSQLEASIAELDRLGAAITRLLEQDRSQRSGAAADVDLATLARDVVADWRHRATTDGREITHVTSGHARARVDPSSMTRLLDLLLEDACHHGRGRIDVDATELATHLRVRVTDEGERRASAEVQHRAPGSLDNGPIAEAAEIAESLGGYLAVDDQAHSRYVLMLPKSPPRIESVGAQAADRTRPPWILDPAAAHHPRTIS